MAARAQWQPIQIYRPGPDIRGDRRTGAPSVDRQASLPRTAIAGLESTGSLCPIRWPRLLHTTSVAATPPRGIGAAADPGSENYPL